jgi:hypothetical protein
MRARLWRFTATTCRGFTVAGPMITGSKGWHEESIEFEMPADGQAAVVRLRRRASMRFDSKIRGTVVVGQLSVGED